MHPVTFLSDQISARETRERKEEGLAREIREKTRKEEGKGMIRKLGSLLVLEGRCLQRRRSCKQLPSKSLNMNGSLGFTGKSQHRSSIPLKFLFSPFRVFSRASFSFFSSRLAHFAGHQAAFRSSARGGGTRRTSLPAARWRAMTSAYAAGITFTNFTILSGHSERIRFACELFV
jgi:hypothetical protein